MGFACNQDTSGKTTSFNKLMTSFDFLSSLVITRSILDVALSVTQSLAIHIDAESETKRLVPDISLSFKKLYIK